MYASVIVATGHLLSTCDHTALDGLPGTPDCHIRTVGLHRVERQSALADQGDEDLPWDLAPLSTSTRRRVTGKDVVRCVLVAIPPERRRRGVCRVGPAWHGGRDQ